MKVSAGARSLAACTVLAAVLYAAGTARAGVINVSPTDPAGVNIAKIEGAGPGDDVIVAPGTYRFRLYLDGQGTAQQPIVIRAADPQNRPVWDLDGNITASWPGSYTFGDRGRSIWQITGAHYVISGIVFRNGTDGGTGDGGGLRFKSSDSVTLRDCLFQLNDNGIQGSGTNTLVEFCEFDRNGLPGSTDASHNIYMHGGDLTLRYSYVHDARRGQNLHLRCNRAVIEYNWIARATTYLGDVMSCTWEPCDVDQYLTLRGNVLIHGTPPDAGQILVMYNSPAVAGKAFHLTMVNNTIIGSGDPAALVHFTNASPALNRSQSAVVSNNVIYDVARVFRVDAPGLANWEASGTNNWVSDGTADTGGLTNTVTGADPGFLDLGGMSYVPAPASPLIGNADATLPEPPVREYYRDETLARYWRWRLALDDIGAFESTTAGDPVGPYDDGGECTTAGAPLACDDGDPCTDDTCNAPSTCVSTPNAAPCDDGDACTTGDTCQAGGCVGTAVPDCDVLDAFLFYRAERVAPDFVKFGPVLLEDGIGSAKYRIDKPTQLGLPAAANAAGPHDPDTHLREYRIKPFAGAPRFQRVTDVEITNQCHASLFLELKKPVTLLVPSAKSLSDPGVPAPDPGTLNLDHFVCYKAKAERALANGASLPPFPKGMQVEVADQLQTWRYDLRKLTKLCDPVAKGEDPGDPALVLSGPSHGTPMPVEPASRRHPALHLVCYKAKLARKLIPQVAGPGGPGTGCGPLDPTEPTAHLPEHASPVPISGVYVSNQFGSEQIDVVKEAELCLPSQLVPAP
jgi:hypothetical protein